MLAHKEQTSETINVRKLILTIVSVYLVVIIAFYYLAGDQLRYRASRGNLAVPTAEIGTVELAGDGRVEQIFTANIQQLRSVSVQIGTYMRATNSGTLTVLLCRDDDGTVLMQQNFDAAAIKEGEILTISSEAPITDVFGLPLRIILYADSQPGCGVSPLMTSACTDGESGLYLNGTETEGTLCFGAEGTDLIWTGLHYWEIAAGFFVILSLFLLVVWHRAKKGERSYIINAIIAVKKYRFLIKQLISRDFKIKYKRSVLGVFWSFLNPLLMMLVQYFVFSTLFRSDIPNFAAYLIIGTVMFNFFSESCGMTLSSILGNAGLITKVYMPKYIYPLTRTMSSMVNLLISLIPLLIVCLVTGVRLTKAAVLALFFLACLVVFCLGLGMLLATSMVFFRDTQFLWGVCTMIWMYATPIFYPETILPPNLKFVHQLNPLYHFLKNARICILNGISPEPLAYLQCLLIALAMLLGGAAVFYKNQDKFVLYL